MLWRSKKGGEQSSLGAVSKISSGLGKIKGVLKTATPVEGSLDAGYLDKDKEVQAARDLSRWKVDIVRYEVVLVLVDLSKIFEDTVL